LVTYAYCGYSFYFLGFEVTKLWLYSGLIAVDIIFVITLFLFFLVYRFSEKRQVAAIKKDLNTPDRYTIKVSNIVKDKDIYGTLADLVNHFQTHFRKFGDLMIVDVNYTLNKGKTAEYKLKLGSLKKQICCLEAQLKIARSQKNQELVKNLKAQHYNCDRKIKKGINEANEFQNRQDLYIRKAYITFNNALVAEQIRHMFFQHPIIRFWKTFKFIKDQEFRYFKGKMLKVVQPNIPTNIIWENLHYRKFEQILRKVVNVALTLTVLGLGLLILTYLRNVLKNYSLVNPNYTCSMPSYTQQMVANYWNQDLSYLKCYCQSTFPGSLSEQLQLSQNSDFNFTGYSCTGTIYSNDPYLYYQNNSPCNDYFQLLDEFENSPDSTELKVLGTFLVVPIMNVLSKLFLSFWRKLLKDSQFLLN